MGENESSYRPDGIPVSWTISPSQSLDFVQDLWASLEPSTQFNFGEIDRHVLRIALERYFRGLSNMEPSAENPKFVALVDKTLVAQNLPLPTEERWRGFLLRNQQPHDPLNFEYSGRPPGGGWSDQLAVISRASLLLRVATGSAQDLLRKAGFDTSTLAFWWKAVGESRGLWDPASPPSNLSDLWADVRDALTDIRDSASGNPLALQSMNGIATMTAGGLGIWEAARE